MTDNPNCSGAGVAGGEPESAPATPNIRIVAESLMAALADKVGLDAELIGSADPEVVVRMLQSLARVDGPLGPAPTPGDELWRDPELSFRRDIVTRALRDELAERLRVPPRRLGQVSRLAAARILSRLQEPPPDQAGGASGERPLLHERRDAIGRALRGSLAERLAVPPIILAGMSAELAARILVPLIELQLEADRLSAASAADGDLGLGFPERREGLARALRDAAAENLLLHPRLLAGLSPVAAATMIARLNAARRDVVSTRARVAIDELTGALTRGAGEAALDREIKRAGRLGGAQLLVVFIDLDSLKAINDRDGHAQGDRLLRLLVTSMTERLRAYDMVIRWGGDEFLCVMPQTDREAATRVMNAILDSFSRMTGGSSFSLGYAVLEEDDSVGAVVGRADAALYQMRRAAAAERPAAAPVPLGEET